MSNMVGIWSTMDNTSLIISSVASILLLTALFRFFSRSSTPKLPPGPFSWPIVGSLFSLRNPLQHHLFKLSKEYGPLIYFKLGQTSMVTVNNAEMAEMFLRVHDLEFAYRPRTLIFKEFSNNYRNFGFAPYGESWKRLKKISVLHLFSLSGLNSTAAFRSHEIKNTIRFIFSNRSSINLKEVVGRYATNVMCLTLFGPQEPSTLQSIVKLTDSIAKCFLNINIGAMFPAVDWLDLHGINKKMKYEIMPKMRSEISTILQQHRLKKAETVSRDFVDVLLSLEGDDVTSDTTITSLLTDMTVAGIETTLSAIEWIMAELLSHPKILLKAQEEIDRVVGRDRLVQESDLPELPFIQAIVKEGLRLHPSVPLGVPHVNQKETIVAGYKIPAKSTVLINIWAIGRDPSTWNEPDVFKPERFLDSEINLVGQSYELIPFSAGRRMCTGYALALRSVPLIVATLVHAFDWKPAPGHRIDLAEVTNLMTGKMAKEVIVDASPRFAESLYV